MSEQALPEIDFQKSITTMFGRALASVDWPAAEKMNQQIYDLVVAEEQADDHCRGIRSYAGGWQSRCNLLMLSEPCIVKLNSTSLHAITRRFISTWQMGASGDSLSRVGFSIRSKVSSKSVSRRALLVSFDCVSATKAGW